MKKKVLAFGASSSTQSINKKLATHTANLLEDVEINLIDLNDFEMPIYSTDRERASGVPAQAKRFKELIRGSDGILISFAEHNGSYSAAFKNLFDWTSRVEGSMWLDKPMFLMATSPGRRGGASVLDAAVDRFGFMGGNVVAKFSLPSFGENFDVAQGITDEALKSACAEQLAIFQGAL